MVDEETLCWDSAKIWTPKSLYEDHTWPRIVEARSGHYGQVNTETFSSGDRMVMLGSRCFPRVVAHDFQYITQNPDNELMPSLDAIKQKGPSYSIPLMLTGNKCNQPCMLQILPLRRSDYVYKTAQDLLETFPRFVKVNRSFFIHSRLPLVKQDTVLELLQTDLRMEAEGTGPSKFLICASGERRIPLKMDTWGDFTVDDDPSSYTLKEVVDRFPLPQRVHFTVMPEGLESNDIVLIEESSYTFLICVPLEVVLNDLVDEDFDVIFFPVSSEAEFFDCTSSRELDVYRKVIQNGGELFGLNQFKDLNAVCPEVSMSEIQFYPYDQVYENLSSRPPLLPRKLPITKTVGKKREHRLPPPLPCDKSDQISPVHRSQPDAREGRVTFYEEAQNWTGGGVEENLYCNNPGQSSGPPAVPPKPKSLQYSTSRATEDKPSAAVSPTRQQCPPLVAMVDRPKTDKAAKDRSHGKVTEKVAQKLGVIKNFFRSRTNSDETVTVLNTQSSLPDIDETVQDSVSVSRSSSESDLDAYDYPELSTWQSSQNYENQPPSFNAVPEEVVQKLFDEKVPRKANLKKSSSNRSEKTRNFERSNNNVLDLSKQSTLNYENMSDYSKSSTLQLRKSLADYSVDEIANHVKESGLARIAAILEEHMVDGDFFKSLKGDQLSCAPFHASLFEIEALKRIQKGKVPKKK